MIRFRAIVKDLTPHFPNPQEFRPMGGARRSTGLPLRIAGLRDGSPVPVTDGRSCMPCLEGGRCGRAGEVHLQQRRPVVPAARFDTALTTADLWKRSAVQRGTGDPRGGDRRRSLAVIEVLIMVESSWRGPSCF